jgi:hypothetical protein
VPASSIRELLAFWVARLLAHYGITEDNVYTPVRNLELILMSEEQVALNYRSSARSFNIKYLSKRRTGS